MRKCETKVLQIKSDDYEQLKNNNLELFHNLTIQAIEDTIATQVNAAFSEADNRKTIIAELKDIFPAAISKIQEAKEPTWLWLSPFKFSVFGKPYRLPLPMPKVLVGILVDFVYPKNSSEGLITRIKGFFRKGKDLARGENITLNDDQQISVMPSSGISKYIWKVIQFISRNLRVFILGSISIILMLIGILSFGVLPSAQYFIFAGAGLALIMILARIFKPYLRNKEMRKDYKQQLKNLPEYQILMQQIREVIYQLRARNTQATPITINSPIILQINRGIVKPKTALSDANKQIVKNIINGLKNNTARSLEKKYDANMGFEKAKTDFTRETGINTQSLIDNCPGYRSLSGKLFATFLLLGAAPISIFINITAGVILAAATILYLACDPASYKTANIEKLLTHFLKERQAFESMNGTENKDDKAENKDMIIVELNNTKTQLLAPYTKQAITEALINEKPSENYKKILEKIVNINKDELTLVTSAVMSKLNSQSKKSLQYAELHKDVAKDNRLDTDKISKERLEQQKNVAARNHDKPTEQTMENGDMRKYLEEQEHNQESGTNKTVIDKLKNKAKVITYSAKNVLKKVNIRVKNSESDNIRKITNMIEEIENKTSSAADVSIDFLRNINAYLLGDSNDTTAYPAKTWLTHFEILRPFFTKNFRTKEQWQKEITNHDLNEKTTKSLEDFKITAKDCLDIKSSQDQTNKPSNIFGKIRSVKIFSKNKKTEKTEKTEKTDFLKFLKGLVITKPEYAHEGGEELTTSAQPLAASLIKAAQPRLKSIAKVMSDQTCNQELKEVKIKAILSTRFEVAG